MNISTKNDKICEACGESFPCTVESGSCWCFEVEITIEKSENLERNFQDCVCPKCLKQSDNLPVRSN